MRRRLLAGLVLLAAACAASPRTRPANQRALSPYIRVVYQRDGPDDPGRWVDQLSARTLRNPETGATATLLSMQHYGSPEYYRSLEAHLRDADVIFAEGWRDASSNEPLRDDQLPEEGRWLARRFSLIGQLLGLQSQLEWEDGVQDRRWVFADMDMPHLSEEIDAEKIEFLDRESKDRVEQLEALVAGSPTPQELQKARVQLERSIMSSVTWFEDPTGPELELHQRREEVMWRVAKEHLSAGKYRHAVFVYGAWHMPVIEAHLVDELGFRPEGACWHDAVVFHALGARR